jgi:rhodanese-related sulfurtransferase
VVKVNHQEIKVRLDKELAIPIDVREHQEVTQFSIPETLHNPMSTFDFDAVPSDTDKRLVFFCAHGIRSRQVGQYLLQENWVSAAYNMTGGIAAWKQAGLPRKS